MGKIKKIFLSALILMMMAAFPALGASSATDDDRYPYYVHLKSGTQFNSAIVNLAGSAENITEIRWVSSMPDGIETTVDVTDNASATDMMVWAGYKDGIIYLQKPLYTGCGVKVNQDASNMFGGLTNVTYIDTSELDTSDVTDMYHMFYKCSELTNLNVRGFKTSNVTNMYGMFGYCSSLTTLDVGNFNTSNVTDIGFMFHNCSGLTNLDVSGFDTSNAINMSWMFSHCSNLITLDVSGFNTSNVTDMRSMFSECSELVTLNINGFNTSKVTKINDMFSGCLKLTALNVSGFDTSNVTSMENMFRMCSKLATLDVSGFDTSKVINMSRMFYNCYSLVKLDVSGFDVSNATDMSSMFYNCSNLTSLNTSGFNMPNATDIDWMFGSCKQLTSLDLNGFDMSKITDTSYMFYVCSNLKTIYISDKWNANKVTSSTNMFYNCTSLVGPLGTTYDSAKVDVSMAHADGGVDNPGYLTDIAYKYVSFTGQPQSKDLGGLFPGETYNNAGNLSYGEEDMLALLTADYRMDKINMQAKLQYFDEDTNTWVDSDVPLYKEVSDTSAAVVSESEQETKAGAQKNGISTYTNVSTDSAISEFMVTLESYVTGTNIEYSQPVDLILVLDQSASMYAPMGLSSGLSNETLYTETPNNLIRYAWDADESTAVTGCIDMKETFNSTETDSAGLTFKDRIKQLGYLVAQSRSGGNVYCTKHTSWHDNSTGCKTYDWFVVQYVEDDADSKPWHMYRIKHTASPSIDSQRNYTYEADLVKFSDAQMESSHFYFYKSQTGALYDAVTSFAATLKENAETYNSEHRLAITGFANGIIHSQNDNHRSGSGIYVGKGYIPYTTKEDTLTYADGYVGWVSDPDTIYNASTITKKQYQSALMSVTNDYDSIMDAINSVKTDYYMTFQNVGLDIALNIVKNATPVSSDTEGHERKEIVVLFTDGEPSGPDQSDVVAKARERKDAGAEIYTICTSTLSADKREFLTNSSSDYPDATVDVNGTIVKGTRISEPKYAKTAENADGLVESFLEIVNDVRNLNVEMNKKTVLQEAVSEYFELPDELTKELEKGNNTTTLIDKYIKAYTSDYDGTTFTDKQEFDDSKITVDKNVNDEYKIVRVENFDYTENYVSDSGRGTDNDDFGKKLIVEIAMNSASNSPGGAGLPVSDENLSGLFNDGVMVASFDMPYANAVDTIDKTPSTIGLRHGDFTSASDFLNRRAKIVVTYELEEEIYTIESYEFKVTATEDTSVSFTLQPSSKDFGHRESSEKVSINYSDGTLAVLSNAASAMLQYYDDAAKAWKDSGIALTFTRNGNKTTISAPEISVYSPVINHKVKLVTEDGTSSDPFYLACNLYTKNPLPTPLSGMTEKNVYGYTVGGKVYLTPNLTDSSVKAEKITWQVSYDHGKSYRDYMIVEKDTTPDLVCSIDADCTMTGNLYRYAVNSSKKYSDPFEIIVYEDYTVSGTTLQITKVGPSGSTNDYSTSSRVYGYRPWESKVSQITTVSHGVQAKQLGNSLYANMTKLKSINLNTVEKIGEEAFAGCTALTHITFPETVKSLGKDALKNTPSLLEVRFKNANTEIDSSADTIPVNYTDSKEPMALEQYRDFTDMMHNYPVVYGYNETSTAYTYALKNKLGFNPIGVIDSNGTETPITWEYTVTNGEIQNLSVSEKSRDLLIDSNGVSLYIPRTIDGYKVTVIKGIDYEEQPAICGFTAHEHDDDCISYTCGYTEETEEHEHTDDCIAYTCGLEEHEHTPFCYNGKKTLVCEDNSSDHVHEEGCYEVANKKDIFGTYTEEDRVIYLNGFCIPDTVKTVDSEAFESMEVVKQIFTLAKECQDWGPNVYGMDEEEKAASYIMCSYSTNYQPRISATGYDQIIFDVDVFSGITGDLTWTLDLKEQTLTFEGNGSSENYTNIASRSYNWARYEINEVVIERGVVGVGDYAYAELPYLRKITNNSNVLKNVASTAFKNSGNQWIYSNKKVDTYVNNSLFDAINTLNDSYTTTTDVSAQIIAKQKGLESLEQSLGALINSIGDDEKENEKIEKQIEELTAEVEKKTEELEKLEDTHEGMKFSFVFRDTTAPCGTDIVFIYDSTELTLTISGSGTMDTFASDHDAPWRPVNEYIRKLTINKDIVSLSNHAFHGMSNLKSVYNYGVNQTLNGGNDDVFDVIFRKTDFANDGTVAYIYVPELGTDEDAYNTQVKEVVETAKLYGLAVTAADIKGEFISCGIEAHTHNDLTCYTDGEFNCTKEVHVHEDSCYSKNAAALTLVPGIYIIRKTATTQEILNILSGKAADLSTEWYIVPVYTFGDDNKEFNESVPPIEDGYELILLYKIKGQCGDNLTFYVSLDNELIIEGYGDMWDFEEGKSPWISAAGYIKSVTFPDEMTSVGSFAFEGTQMLTEFTLPDEVTKIGTCAFKDCINLSSFNIKDTMEEVGEGLFAGCTSLRVVTSDNPHYSVKDGHLMKDDGTLLGFLRETLYEDAEDMTQFINDVSYSVPEDVKVIGAYAYYKASSFYSLYIPESVTEIHAKAFYGMEALENIDTIATEKQIVDGSFLDGCGTLYDKNDSKKYVILYKANSDFETVAARQGYTIIYHDAKDISYITAVYTGGPVMVGKAFAMNDVNISIVYANGESENIFATDQRITFAESTVKLVGENYFHATFNDGYGQILQTNDFMVEGSDAVNGIEFSYTGSYIWYGESLIREYILAKITSASGKMETINGNATYSTASGNKFCITLDKMTADKDGDIEFNAIYQNEGTGTLAGSFKVRCLNYITGLDAEYGGGSVELAAGTAGLDLDELHIMLSWADGTTESILGSDPRVEVSSEYQVSGNNLIFEYTINDRNRYDKIGSFSCGYSMNLSAVDFDYIGAAVTNGMTFSFSDVQLTLRYSDGTSQKVLGDTVTGLEADNMVIHTSDGMEEIHLTYTVGAQVFTGTIYIPGKYRTPVKLIVVKRPTKTVYKDGDVFDPAGMVVNCIFNNGVTENVTEDLQIDGGDNMTANTKYVTLIYEDISSGYTVQTNMSINVNQFQKSVTLQKTFKEQYEISKILFRSKKTEDNAEDMEEDSDNNGEIDEDEESVGKWQDITPLLSYSSYDSDHQAADAEGNSLYAAPVIKAGYGFELKVFTRYRTNRAGSEFNAFMKKSQWDAEFEDLYTDIDHDTFENRWKYLNDVYPQAAPTANPDIMYFRIVNTNLVDEEGNPIKNLTGIDGNATDFLVMEKTNLSETNQEIDEGEWYNSTKVFELPLRTTVGEEETRRVYVSKDAANPDQAYTEYTMQIISPAWYGYDPEPYFSGSEFKYSTDDGETYANKSYAYNDMQTKYLHVCAEVVIRVKANNDIHTHILE